MNITSQYSPCGLTYMCMWLLAVIELYPDAALAFKAQQCWLGPDNEGLVGLPPDCSRRLQPSKQNVPVTKV